MHDEILDFWFGPRDSAEYGKPREIWFRKDDATDLAIGERFGAAVDTALEGGFGDWTEPRPALARVLLLDQFTRNVFRGTPRSFAGDALALALSKAAVARGDDSVLTAVERWFMYMPFEHAEDADTQRLSLELFTRLRDETGMADPLAWAKRHAAVVARFGRYPHRNAILGRDSTAEEIAFLAQPGSGF